MDIRIEISDHAESKSLCLIEVHFLSILGIWKKMESWSVYTDVAEMKVEELRDFYLSDNEVWIDSNVSFIDCAVWGSEDKLIDSIAASNERSKQEIASLFEEAATPRPALSVVRGNGGNEPSPSSKTSEAVDKSSMPCSPSADELSPLCATHGHHLSWDPFNHGKICEGYKPKWEPE